MLKKLILAMLVSLTLSQFAFGTTFNVDPVHSQIRFSVKHLMLFTVRGSFTDFSGDIQADARAKTLQSINGNVKISSIDTREAKRDGHLKSPDFFDSQNHPNITFVSKKILGSGDNITVTGDITIRGITRTIDLTGRFVGTAKDPWGYERAGFFAKGKISRKDFNIVWNQALEAGGVMVGDEIQITLEIQALKQS